MPSAAIVARFHTKYIPEPNSGCWLWNACLHGHGYGMLSLNKKPTYGHRLSYEIHIGPIPSGLHVCHRCDNPPCVNPAHLFLGTAKDNSDDRDRKGRTRPGRASPERHGSRTKPHRVPRGFAHGMSVLTPEIAIDIMARRARGESPRAIADLLGISRHTIWKVSSGRSYASPAREVSP